MSERDIRAENLAYWQEKLADNRELRLLQLADLAKDATKALLADEVRDLKKLRVAPCTGECASVADTRFFAAVSLDEQIAFCKELLAHLHGGLFPAAPLATAPRGGRLVTLSGTFSDAATNRFSEVTNGARAHYLPSFSEACEAVREGQADFAVLPIEDSFEGRLFHFLHRIEQDELCITHTCDIPYPDENRTMRLALLANAPFASKAKGERLLECTLPEESEHTVADLLCGALSCGLTLRRIDSLPIPYLEDGFSHRAVFHTSEENELLFEAFLAIYLPRAQITAKYTHLN